MTAFCQFFFRRIFLSYIFLHSNRYNSMLLRLMHAVSIIFVNFWFEKRKEKKRNENGRKWKTFIRCVIRIKSRKKEHEKRQHIVISAILRLKSNMLLSFILKKLCCCSLTIYACYFRRNATFVYLLLSPNIFFL